MNLLFSDVLVAVETVSCDKVSMESWSQKSLSTTNAFSLTLRATIPFNRPLDGREGIV